MCNNEWKVIKTVKNNNNKSGNETLNNCDFHPFPKWIVNDWHNDDRTIRMMTDEIIGKDVDINNFPAENDELFFIIKIALMMELEWPNCGMRQAK